MTNLRQGTVMVTGASDMIGLHLLTTLRRLGVDVVGVGDLHADLGSLQYLEQEIRRFRPRVIFYVPSERYGIAVHRDHPGSVYYEAITVFSHLLEAARLAEVGKVVNVLSNCVYPESADVPHREEDMWSGLPAEALVPYGMGRRMSLIHAATYREEYGLATISLVLASVYGANDNFDPTSSQVMASMVRRFAEATERGSPVETCWGDGTPTREFMHVRDAVRGVIEAAIHYDDPAPLNVCTGQEIAIRELAERVARLAGYEGRIEWDTSKPGGRRRVCLDPGRMRERLPSWPLVGLDDGIRETLDWYRKTAMQWSVLGEPAGEAGGDTGPGDSAGDPASAA